MEVISVSIRMPKEVKKKLDQAAKKQRRTRSAIVLRGIELAISEGDKE